MSEGLVDIGIDGTAVLLTMGDRVVLSDGLFVGSLTGIVSGVIVGAAVGLVLGFSTSRQRPQDFAQSSAIDL